MINLNKMSQYIDPKLLELFALNKPFTQNLTKWQDDRLKDKYDHNYFEYSAQPSEEEFQKAFTYQKERGDNFIKLEGNFPLKNSFGMEEGITLTMTLKEDRPEWKTNPNVRIATPTIEELEEIELKHYGEIYGRDFTIRNIRRNYEKLNYIGAYLDETLVGACYYFAVDGVACFDGLLVDTDYRGRYIATTIIKEVVKRTLGNVLFLHADDDDTPKEMYEKMGFEVINKVYEYSCSDLSEMSINEKGGLNNPSLTNGI